MALVPVAILNLASATQCDQLNVTAMVIFQSSYVSYQESGGRGEREGVGPPGLIPYGAALKHILYWSLNPYALLPLACATSGSSGMEGIIAVAMARHEFFPFLPFISR